MRYHLLQDLVAERKVIVDDLNLEVFRAREENYFFELASVEADDWIRAKALLGYELTSLQQELLPLTPEGREERMRQEAWCGMWKLMTATSKPLYLGQRKGWLSKTEPSKAHKPSAAVKQAHQFMLNRA